MCCSPQVAAKFPHYLGNACVASCISEQFVKKETAAFSCSVFSDTQPSDLFVGPWQWTCFGSCTICESAPHLWKVKIRKHTGKYKKPYDKVFCPLIIASRNDCLKSCSTISLLGASINHQKDAARSTSQPSLWGFQYSELQWHLLVTKAACRFLTNPLFPGILRSLDVLLHDLLKLELFYTDSQSSSCRRYIGNA